MGEIVHLHLHDEFSYLDSTIKLEELQKVCVKRNIKSIAQTNHGNIDGCVRFYNAMKEAGIKPIIGCEAYVVDNIEKKDIRYHLTLLTKSEKGFRNLCYLLSKGWQQSYEKKSRITFEDILDFGDDLIVLSGCYFSPFHFYSQVIQEFIDKFGDDFYIEIMPFEENFVGKENSLYFYDHIRFMLGIAKRYNLKVVLTNDVHYIEQEDADLYDVVRAIRLNKKWNDKNRETVAVRSMYLKTYEEMLQTALKQRLMTEETIRQALNNTYEIAEKCNLELKKLDVSLPIPEEFEGINVHEALKELCLSGLRRKKKENDKKYIERLHNELQVVIPKFTTYFLIIYELVHWAKSNGIFVGPARGSVGGSLIAYLLGITQIDPIKYDLLFERFITEKRIDLPDIDVDFEDSKRELVIKHLKDKYGVDKVAYVSTFSNMRSKMVIRDLGRIFSLPLSIVEVLSKLVGSLSDTESDRVLTNLFSVSKVAKNFKEDYPKITEYMIKLEGLIRQKGVHAAGIVLSSEALAFSGRGVLEVSNEGAVLNWDKKDLEFFGFAKYDILGVKTLSVLREAADLVNKRHNIKINYEELSLDDEKVYELFKSGESYGIFQFQRSGIARYCKEVGISDFKTLCDISALYRPSGTRSGVIDTYVKRKKKLEPVTYSHSLLEPVLKDTYGVAIYQEQVMLLLHRLAGLTWEVVDEIRKVISKSQGEEKMLKYKNLFIEGCQKMGTLNKNEAEKIFNLLVSFSHYGFNKSHSVGYSVLSYWTAYMKRYYPFEYFCAYLRYKGEERECFKELSRLKIKVIPPDINTSDVSWSVVDDSILVGLSTIKGVGDKASTIIVEERKRGGVFKNLFDFLIRVKCNSNVISALAKAGSLDTLIKNYNEYKMLVEGNKDKLIKYLNKGDSLSLFIQEDSIEINEKQKYVYKKEVVPFLVDEFFGIYSGIAQFLKENIKLADIEKLKERVGIQQWGLGIFTNIRFGGNGKESYGIFSNDTKMVILRIDPHLLEQKRELIERLEGNPVLVSCILGVVMDVILLEDIFSGRLDNLSINFFKELQPVELDLYGLNMCHERCKAVGKFVPIDLGKYRIMIVGEAPGIEEDLLGKPFVGRSGELLWKTLETWGLNREMFCISNVMKCLPNQNKKIEDKKDAIACVRKFLLKEIEVIKPTSILCLGSTVTKLLSGESIMNKVGMVEWNDTVNTFVVYSIHPASALYQAQNRELFELCVENFVRFLSKQGLLDLSHYRREKMEVMDVSE